MWTPSGWPMGQTGTNVMWPYPYASGWQNQLARYSHGLNPAAAPVAPSESTSSTNSSTSGTPQTSESSGLTTSSIPIPSYSSSAPTASPPHAYPPNPSLMSYPIAHLSSFNSLNYNVNPVVQHPYAQYSLPMNMAPSIPIPQPSLYPSSGPDPSLLVPSSKSGSTPPPKTPASNSAFSSVHKPLASPVNRKRASGDSDTPPPFVPLKSVKVTAVVPDHSDSDGENSLQARQQRPFQCVDCGKRFRRSDHLQSHVKSHNGEYPYVCALCDKTFKRSDHMIIHMRGHSGEKPFDCQQCKKSYSSKSSLMRHKRIHNHM